MTPYEIPFAVAVIVLLALLWGPARLSDLRTQASRTWLIGYEPAVLDPGPLPEWADTAVDVHVPDLEHGPRRRVVTGSECKLAAHQRDQATAWLWDRSTGPAIPAVGPMAQRLAYSGWGA